MYAWLFKSEVLGGVWFVEMLWDVVDIGQVWIWLFEMVFDGIWDDTFEELAFEELGFEELAFEGLVFEWVFIGIDSAIVGKTFLFWFLFKCEYHSLALKKA